ncbi:hypothetical protein LJJ44_18665 [Pseudomonas sp. B24_DOA]|nr:hypothetical protein LJJ44_18665 [Pseudomonas sp. B24_DOA]WKV88849.1 hypothetical protein LJU32_26705 [Pseudomonas sp. B21_DOA]
MIDTHPILHSALTVGLIQYLSEQPLYEFCNEQITDVCELINQCCIRIQTGDISSDLSSMCIQTTMHEEAIFQYASTDKKTVSRIGFADTASVIQHRNARHMLPTSWHAQ